MKEYISNNQEKALDILNSDYLTSPTQAVLQERFEKTGNNRFFEEDAFTLLNAVCDLLMDQNAEERMVDVALEIDQRLFNNESDGWRYNLLPPDPISYTLGLKGIDQTAIYLYKAKFIALPKDQQIMILNAIQSGAAEGEIWKELNQKLFFEDILAETAEVFFSHPVVQASINYVGMADAKGWTKIQLDQKEHLEIKYTSH